MSGDSQKKRMQTEPRGAHFPLGPVCNKKGEERRAKKGLNGTLAPWEFTSQFLEGSTCQERLYLPTGCVSSQAVNVICDGDLVHIPTWPHKGWRES